MRTDTRTRKMAAVRHAYLFPVWVVLLVAALARPAAAQDFNPGQYYIDLSADLLRTELINSAIRIGTENYKSGSNPSSARLPDSKFDSRYRADPAVTRRVVNEYLSFVRSTTGEQAMREVREDLERYNFVTVWRDIVRSSGAPAGDDMADALSSYLLLNWAMANGRMRDEDNKAAYLAVRNQVRGAMTLSPAFAKLSNADRQGFAETMMVNFVIQHAAMQHAVRSNDKNMESRLGDAAQQRFMNDFGMNLRALHLTGDGLVTRPSSGVTSPDGGRPKSRPRP